MIRGECSPAWSSTVPEGIAFFLHFETQNRIFLEVHLINVGLGNHHEPLHNIAYNDTTTKLIGE